MVKTLDSSLARERLQSELPSERMESARFLLTHETDITTAELVRAMAQESVPPIRRILRLAAQLKSGAESASVRLDDDSGELSAAEIVRHELEPAIGWIRMAAVRELNGLEGSELETEIARLEERMEGLISVLEVERAPIRYSVVELLDAVADSVPLHVTGIPDLALEVERDEATAIESDRNLLSVILRNALNNATDALTDLPPEDRLLSARLLIDESTFQLSIFNTTVARSVESEEASISGITTKTGHRGYGLKIMQIAARRLGYEVRLDISGGLASLTLRGPVGGPE